VRVNDKNGQSAGNIDVVLVAYDDRGRVTDFGSLEVQGVYISGNVRRPFERYMSDPARHYAMDWTKERNYPRPDYLSSSRKRLAPQLLYKGGILSVWGKKQAVALHRGFFNTLPTLTEVEPHEAEIAWLVYDLTFDASQNLYRLSLHRAIYTSFQVALDQIATPQPGPMVEFMEYLQEKLDEKLEQGENPPDAPILTDLL
jgi:hypothetical protein